LDRFGVDVTHGVDPRDMIPGKFFEFNGLEQYEDCISLTFPTLILSR
jgi:hypothetical protein